MSAIKRSVASQLILQSAKLFSLSLSLKISFAKNFSMSLFVSSLFYSMIIREPRRNVFPSNGSAQFRTNSRITALTCRFGSPARSRRFSSPNDDSELTAPAAASARSDVARSKIVALIRCTHPSVRRPSFTANRGAIRSRMQSK